MLEELSGDFLQWLRGFYYVANTGSIRRAAELMHRNPSTISYQIRNLEQELNVVLFDRCKKSLRITQEGKKLLEWTITTFETLESMRSEVGSADGNLQGRVEIAITLPFAALTVGVITKFCQNNPNVEVNLLRSLSYEAQTSVRESKVDFAMTGVLRIPEKDHMDVLFKARPMLVVRRDHPWHIPVVPTVDVLQKLPFISFLPQDLYREGGGQSLERAVRQTYQRKVAITVNNYHIMLRFVLQGLGVAVLDEVCLRATLFGADWSPLISYPLDHILPNVLYGILTRRNKHFSPQAEALRAEVKSHMYGLQPLQPLVPEVVGVPTSKEGASAPRRRRQRKMENTE
ncbi:LysR family transcriptional regulator [Desulfovibrio desulfuricans]|uniref:LysR family transcriptional regulator n=1 Tax=Desulfovibrio desulfuricans TaxID=876 RepID=UPI001D07ABBA|nr:LysR family transcriptional regulator [Desulfovibrio desulfuricans]MCB6543252.1 LysR family transcriptional regulator [Desulfovibrio desulfuricans]MCB6554075.1 LysR family transcriptional regulator [Desulfovibrio desulfuricans]MCB6565991.1 LysR family transcriptional regulator [Desulfovibrio desulfuricans]MCB7347119.1 LysR family transcriptional regulator [Desulfovibrio desulfuricans]MCQ5219367.1 LysR family transcriptional regulator [Desulfovibrio desulfuricans]